VVEVVLITVGVAVGATVLAGLTWGAVRVHRYVSARKAVAICHRLQSGPVVLRAEVIPLDRPALDPPRPRLAGPGEAPAAAARLAPDQRRAVR
jgi:hypothetical protein